MTTKKFCTKCGNPFVAIGREVICPACKAHAADDAKRAAVERAKRASWAGESVPVRISGRASTVIRVYGKANGMPFAAALDDLLKASDYFRGVGVAWESVEPYKSHRRDKPQEAPQTAKAAKTAETVTAEPATPAAPVKPSKAASASKAAKKAVKTVSKK